jgi:hypothetical protein
MLYAHKITIYDDGSIYDGRTKRYATPRIRLKKIALDRTIS